MKRPLHEVLAESTEATLELLLTDATLAQTMLDRAEITQDPDTRIRNVQNATHAADSIAYFMMKLSLNDPQRDRLTEALTALRARIEKVLAL